MLTLSTPSPRIYQSRHTGQLDLLSAHTQFFGERTALSYMYHMHTLLLKLYLESFILPNLKTRNSKNKNHIERERVQQIFKLKWSVVLYVLIISYDTGNRRLWSLIKRIVCFDTKWTNNCNRRLTLYIYNRSENEQIIFHYFIIFRTVGPVIVVAMCLSVNLILCQCFHWSIITKN